MALVRKESETRVPKRRLPWDRIVAEAMKQGTGQYSLEAKAKVPEHQARRAANTLNDKFQILTWIERDSDLGTEWTTRFELSGADIHRLCQNVDIAELLGEETTAELLATYEPKPEP